MPTAAEIRTKIDFDIEISSAALPCHNPTEIVPNFTATPEFFSVIDVRSCRLQQVRLPATPPGCHSEIEWNFSGNPTSFDVIVRH
jgi:hypothetical protein